MNKLKPLPILVGVLVGSLLVQFISYAFAQDDVLLPEAPPDVVVCPPCPPCPILAEPPTTPPEAVQKALEAIKAAEQLEQKTE